MSCPFDKLDLKQDHKWQGFIHQFVKKLVEICNVYVLITQENFFLQMRNFFDSIRVNINVGSMFLLSAVSNNDASLVKNFKIFK